MNMLSLFSGCGGMDIGFEGSFKCLKKSINESVHPDWIREEDGEWVTVAPTIFQTVFANDIRPDAKAAWVSYFSNKRNDTNNIYHLDSIVDLVKKAKSGEKIFPDNIDIVTGGFPCQDFSVSGKRLGFRSQKSHLGYKLENDEPSVESRGQLYMWMREVITLTEPKLFIAENVKGLTNLEDVKEVIEHDFAEAGNGGYLVVPAKVLYAPDYGVPQSRERVIFFGFKKNALTKKALLALKKPSISEAYNPYPPASHGGEGLKPIVTCADAFVGLVEPNESDDPSQKKYSKAKYMGAHCQGQTEIRLDSVGPTIRSEHHGNIEYRRLDRAHGGKHLEELKEGLPERRLTVRECARIQTFPDDYQFILKKTDQNVSVSSSDAYKIIGNAVPCVLAYNIAKNIEAKWNMYFKEESNCMDEYNELLNRVVQNVQKRMEKLDSSKITGIDFENIVYEELLAVGIDKSKITHSKRTFPDFVIEDKDTCIGVEVKKTESNKWDTLGGSIYESLRNQIKETFVLMGKFGETPEARIRKYENCISGLSVTHSPRFRLNLDLPEGDDFLTKNEAFDLLSISDEKELNRRIRELLRTGKSTWYSEETIENYSKLSADEKQKLFVNGVVLFPEVIGSNYSKFAPWMIYSCLVWCSNVRDVFSAGGTKDMGDFIVSAIMGRIFERIDLIIDRISKMTTREIEEHWKIKKDMEFQERVELWVTLVEKYIRISESLKKDNKSKYPDLFKHKRKDNYTKIIKERFVRELRRKINSLEK